MADEKIKIIVDSRESIPYLFKDYKDVIIIRDNLDVGDYSLIGEEENIMLERKTLSDLCGSFTSRRGEFEDMWKRAIQKVKFLMIEGRMSDILWGNYRSQLTPQSLIASILSWSMKYRFSWFCVDNEVEGMKAVYWFLREYLHNKEKEEV